MLHKSWPIRLTRQLAQGNFAMKFQHVACHEMWNNGALFAETAQKLILGKYFFSVLSCTHNKLPSFLAMDRISELNRTKKAT